MTPELLARIEKFNRNMAIFEANEYSESETERMLNVAEKEARAIGKEMKKQCIESLTE